MNFTVVFENSEILIIEKSAGLLSQGDDSGDQSLVDEMKSYLKQDFVGLVHRLDRNTSGLMAIAKNPQIAKKLTEQIKSENFERRYQALLFGECPESFSWQHFLEKNPKKNHVTVFRRASPNSKEARLKGQRLKLFPLVGENSALATDSAKDRLVVSLVEIQLETGRSHQIRAQAAFEGHPVLGDRRYGSKLPASLQLLDRPALHSSYLALVVGGKKLEFHSPIDLTPFPINED